MNSPIKKEPPREDSSRGFVVPDPQSAGPLKPSREDALPLPHERDQGAELPAAEGEHGPRGLIEQAGRDIRRGLRDTDRHGTPSDVPGPGVSPDRSPGAAVPEGGVDIAGESRHSVIPDKR